MSDVYEAKHRRADGVEPTPALRTALFAQARNGSTHRRAAEEVTV